MSNIPLGLISLFIGIPMILIDLWLIYVIRVHTEKAESLMPTSAFVESNKSAYAQAGLLGKAIRNGFLTLVLAMPTLCHKRGIVSLADVRNLPPNLKRLLFLLWGLCALFLTALMILGAYIKLSKSSGL
ncbi:hypothetical protein [Pseudomonas huanghezhanensis]|uniref:hypothetical protein n=1 Tax=Pseudomonas huanghezhanensis TaxID=3002903 RepID=UPI0022869C91|nr:hypothetical protein [Pseudomonas sp. BSw22131]